MSWLTRISQSPPVLPPTSSLYLLVVEYGGGPWAPPHIPLTLTLTLRESLKNMMESQIRVEIQQWINNIFIPVKN